MERDGLIMFEEKNNTIDGVIFEKITKWKDIMPNISLLKNVGAVLAW